jgi:ABC-type branched-subunit amino acid transport system ATPase component
VGRHQDHGELLKLGENASGKSTITDAIEWSIKGRVDIFGERIARKLLFEMCF